MNLLEKSPEPRFTDLFTKYGLVHLIESPTRVTQHTSTLIDHVYVTTSDYVKQVSVPKISINDHFPVCIQCYVQNYLASTVLLRKEELNALMIKNLLIPLKPVIGKIVLMVMLIVQLIVFRIILYML